MSLVKEFREKVDYTYVINIQLDRIGEMRSKIFQVQNPLDDQPLKWSFLTYLSHVEALYTILLPELRGNARKYLKIARKLFIIETKGYNLSRELEELKKYYKSKERIDEVEKQLNELKEEWEKTLKELSKDGVEAETTGFLWARLAYVVDKAVEEMLRKLNEAGLLLGGKKVMVGVAGKGR